MFMIKVENNSTQIKVGRLCFTIARCLGFFFLLSQSYSKISSDFKGYFSIETLSILLKISKVEQTLKGGNY